MFLTLSKIIFIIFIFYTSWFQKRYFSVPNLLLVLGLGMVVLLFMHKYKTANSLRLSVPKPLILWILFALYCLFTGVLLTSGSGHFITSWITYIQILAMIFYVVNVSMMEKSNKFFVKVYFALSFVYLMTMILDGFVTRQGRLYLSEASNPNSDGMLLFAGMFCLLMLINKKKVYQIAAGLIASFVYMYVIIQTGSRKSFLIAFLFLFMWIVLNFRALFAQLKASQKISLFVVAGVILFASIVQIIPQFLQSALYSRLVTRGILISDDEARSLMYKEAWQFYLDNPLFGIGFKQFEIRSSLHTYSHSTYAEIISTTGTFGTMLYFSSYILVIYNLLRIWRRGRNDQANDALQYLLLMACMLILATGVIHFYSIQDNVMFAMMISFNEINRRNPQMADKAAKAYAFKVNYPSIMERTRL